MRVVTVNHGPSATSGMAGATPVSTTEGTWKTHTHLRTLVIISSTSKSRHITNASQRFAKLINSRKEPKTLIFTEKQVRGRMETFPHLIPTLLIF